VCTMLGVKIASLVAGLGLTGAVIGSDHIEHSREEPLRCEIQRISPGEMTSLQGVIETDKAVSGTYEFRVVSSGRGGQSNVRQGGAFSATSGGVVKLASIMVGGSGTSFDASLEITLNGKTIECSDSRSGI